MIKLEGRTAIVTGSSSGMGEQIARALATEGMRVMLSARRGDRLETIAAEIRAAGGAALVQAADCTREDEVAALFRAADAGLGDIDLLVNSTGAPQSTSIVDMSLEEWRRVIDANLTSVFLTGRGASSVAAPRGR